MRVCEPELNLFEECVHDPRAFARFQAMATPMQREAKDYFSTMHRKNYFFWKELDATPPTKSCFYLTGSIQS